jgi:signal transduction histidine kinase
VTLAMRPSRELSSRALLLLACLIGLVLLSRQSDWRPVWLVVGLMVAALASDRFVVSVTTEFSITAAFVPLVLGGVLLGPCPAGLIGVISSVLDGRRRALTAREWLGNALSFGVLGLVVGLAGRALHTRLDDGMTLFVEAGLLYLAATLVSLALASLNTGALRQDAMGAALRPVFPSEALLALAAGVGALLYRDHEYAALASLGAVSLLFQYFASGLLNAKRSAQEVGELAERQTRLVAQLAAAQSSARSDLANALHAGPLQTLLSARQDLSERDLVRAERSVAASLEEIRHIMLDLHLPAFPTNPEASLQGLATALRDRYAVAIDVEFDGVATDEIPQFMFDAAQELLRNAARHAQASSIRCELRCGASSLVLDVTDDGIGFGRAELERALASGHIGMAALKAQLDISGGTLEIGRNGERGSRVTVELPER